VYGNVDSASKSKECRYSFDPNKAVQRIRYAKFVAHVRATFGEKAEKVFEAVVEHGRVTWTQLKESCAQMSDELLRETGDQLLREKYITRVLSAPTRAINDALGPASKAKSSSSNNSRKRKIDDPESSKGNPIKMRRGDGESVRSLIDDVVSEETAVYESVSTPGSVWCVNPAAFDWDFRSIAICQLVSDRYGQATASLMKLLLKTVRNRALQPSSVGNKTYAATVDALIAQQKICGQEGQDPQVPMTWEGLSESLNALSQDSFHSVQKINDGGPEGVLYRPQVAELMTHLRRQVVESIIEKRFKPRGRRLFRLLMDRCFLCKHFNPFLLVPSRSVRLRISRSFSAQLLPQRRWEVGCAGAGGPCMG
jgi:hypothetical protein